MNKSKIKTIGLIFILLMSTRVSSRSHSIQKGGTGDIGSGDNLKEEVLLSCSNERRDIELVKISENYLVRVYSLDDKIDFSIVGDFSQLQFHSNKATNLIAISEKVEEQGVLGFGLQIYIDGGKAYLSYQGMIEILRCNHSN